MALTEILIHGTGSTPTAEVPEPAEPPTEPTLPDPPIGEPALPNGDGPKPGEVGSPEPADPHDPDTGEDEGRAAA